MVGVSASVNLPLHDQVQKFSSGTGSPGWSRKKDRKTVVVVCFWIVELKLMSFAKIAVQLDRRNILYISYVVSICCLMCSLLGFDSSHVKDLCHAWTKVQQEGSWRSSKNGRRHCKQAFVQYLSSSTLNQDSGWKEHIQNDLFCFEWDLKTLTQYSVCYLRAIFLQRIPNSVFCDLIIELLCHKHAMLFFMDSTAEIWLFAL